MARYIRMAVDALQAELAVTGDVDDPKSAAALYKAGAIRVMLKGGNSINMLKYRAVECLPPPVRAVLSDVKPSNLSDVDFLLLINFETPGCEWQGVKFRVQGGHLNPLGFVLLTSIQSTWSISSAFLPS
jgi:hypothetical protein